MMRPLTQEEKNKLVKDTFQEAYLKSEAKYKQMNGDELMDLAEQKEYGALVELLLRKEYEETAAHGRLFNLVWDAVDDIQADPSLVFYRVLWQKENKIY